MASAPVSRGERTGDPGWNRIGAIAASTAGGALLVQTLLYLTAAAGLLGPSPTFHRTAAGPLQDTATYYAAYFAHQHHILWDIALRDSIGPIGWIGLMVAALAVANLIHRRPSLAQLIVVLVAIGAGLEVLEDLTFLSLTNYWRNPGWRATPAAGMVAVGRAVESIDSLSSMFQRSGYVILAVALFLVGLLCRTEVRLPSRLAPLAYALSLGVFASAIASILEATTAFNIVGLAVGVVLGPAFLLWLGRHLALLARSGSDVAEPAA
ncbi:MAG TPA: hypothetical protein VKA30_00725 [Actinomycetota bacterium]|nr:hypothetical protein [Actinomycetota bacterium]